MQPENSKICTKCEQSKLATRELWDAHKLGRFGLNPVCKQCRKQKRAENYAKDYATQQQWKSRNRTRYLKAQREWKDKNREYKLELDRKYYAEHRSDSNAKRRAHYRANKSDHYRNARQWVLQNPEKARAYARRYVAKYPEKAAAGCRLRQAIKLQRTPEWLTREQRHEMVAFYREARRLTKETGIKHHVDHIVPLQGKTVSGLHVPWNLEVLTAEVNIRKSNRLVTAANVSSASTQLRGQRSLWEDA